MLLCTVTYNKTCSSVRAQGAAENKTNRNVHQKSYGNKWIHNICTNIKPTYTLVKSK